MPDFPDLSTLHQDTWIFPACWILIGQFKFAALQPHAKWHLLPLSNKNLVAQWLVKLRRESTPVYGQIHYARKFEYYAFERHPKKPSIMPEIMLEKHSIMLTWFLLYSTVEFQHVLMTNV